MPNTEWADRVTDPHGSAVTRRFELFGTAVWEELERRKIAEARVAFSGCAGRGGLIERVTYVGTDTQRAHTWLRDELSFALEAPVWERYGSFAGHPAIHADVVWRATNRAIVIRGSRGDERFEERVG